MQDLKDELAKFEAKIRILEQWGTFFAHFPESDSAGRARLDCKTNRSESNYSLQNEQVKK